MGQAIAYALGQWDSLQIFLRDGRLEIDNNLVENQIRPTFSPVSLPPLVPGAATSAVGKKNWLFIGAAHAGQRGAIIYPLIESCRRRGIDPYAYLRDLLTKFPSMTTSQIKDLTPEA